jgi:predicted pyridoxine 5'-phosphate oxidase superfamily flavin-nucleotide-binding protein
MQEQRRGGRIAMSEAERDEFLNSERTCRVATVDAQGTPHVAPLWFVWDGTSLWLNSLTRSQRWANLVRDPRVSVVIDAGHEFLELCGVEMNGRLEVVGEVPRTAEPVEQLVEPERLFGEKYAGGTFVPDGRHAWCRLTPEKIVSWDFSKMVGG